MKVKVICTECETALSIALEGGYAEGRCSYCWSDIEVEYDGAELVSTYGCQVAA